MWASNAKDEFNANMLTECQPGRVQQNIFTVNPWTGNYGDKTQLYLPNDGRERPG